MPVIYKVEKLDKYERDCMWSGPPPCPMKAKYKISELDIDNDYALSTSYVCRVHHEIFTEYARTHSREVERG